ncbi:unnamed protein product [Rotaria sordida]|uniref:Methyltransferase type 11 domain-containing protein n=1 Tax=Rotaria sordida TaxID=392033 RepID=A0A815JFN6_9BILA|nr:unnamed protein product [Rotaria sordida]CAF1378895.1 unnamed protein product [Rotaria sordida]
MKCLIKTVFWILSVFVGFIAIGLGYLKVNDTVREKFFAKTMNAFSNENDTAITNIRCNQVLNHASVHGHVLEIGSGTGINFVCLHNNTRIKDYIGIEPNIHMHSYMQETINRWQIQFPVRISGVSAATMTDIESDSIDTIIMTFVLCSVPDPFAKQILLEAYRVLKPGGQFHLIEHVLSDPNIKPMTNSFQKLIEPIWTIAGDGCRFKPIVNDLDEMKTIYSNVEYENIELPVPFFIIKDGLKAVLTK